MSHVFVDAVVRRCLRSLRLPGERRVHFQAESDPRRRKIVSALVSLQVETAVYLARGRDDGARAVCLRRMVADCRLSGAQRVVLESRGPAQDRKDRRTIAETLAAVERGGAESMGYLHLRCYEEPALWIPDAVAWCYGAGGEWQMRVGPLVKDVVDLRNE